MDVRVIIYGYYGFGNAGDEAVLAGMLRGLRQHGPDNAHYVVLSGNPAHTATWHGTAALPRDHWRTVWREAKQADAWIFGGGSLLQDVTGPWTLPYYMAVLTLLLGRRQNVFFHGHGIGPIQNRFNRKYAALLLRRVQRVSVRDTASAALLAQFGVAPDRLHAATDTAFLLPATAARVRRKKAVPTIGLALRDWTGSEQWQKPCMRAVQRFAQATDGRIVFIPMHEPDDRQTARRIQAAERMEATIVPEAHTVAARMQQLAACDIVVSMRLHAGILSALAGVPAVMCAYDPKVTAFAQHVKWPVHDVQRLEEQALLHSLHTTWKQRDHIAQQTEQRVRTLQHMAQQDIAALGEALHYIAGRTKASCRVSPS